jgi:hypothetical protein
MKTLIFALIIFLLSINIFGNEQYTHKAKPVKYHDLLFPFYNIHLGTILKKKKQINSVIFVNLDYQIDEIIKYIPKYYFKTDNFRPIRRCNSFYDSSLSVSFLIFKMDDKYYARLATDTAVFIPVEIKADLGGIFDKQHIRRICFDSSEVDSFFQPNETGGGGSCNFYYWDFKEIYYFVHSRYNKGYSKDKGLSECAEYKAKGLCADRIALLDKLISILTALLEHVKFEKYHNISLFD